MPDNQLPAENNAKDTISWVLAAVQEGEAFLSAQFGYNQIDQAVSVIQGENANRRLIHKDLSHFQINLVGKVVSDNVASLTDIKPYFSYRTSNPMFQAQADIFNNLAQSWWMTNFIDLKIAGAVQLAIPAGCSYLQFIWNPELQGGKGDLDLIPRDARDVIPIRPTASLSIQDSMGVIVRSDETINFLKSKYPHLKDHIKADRDLAFTTRRTISPTGALGRFLSPMMSRMKRARQGGPIRVPGKEVFTVYLKDDRVNHSGRDVAMGFDHKDRARNWSYIVKPGEPLYPRGRTIICSEDIVYYDGPNVFLFDSFPLIKLYMDMSFVYPDSYFSKPVTQDLLQLNEMVNEIVSGVIDNVRKELRPNIIADIRAISKTKLDNFDSRRGGQYLRVRRVGDKPIEFVGGTELKQYVFEMLTFGISQIESLSGSQDLSNLARLKQMPAKETIEEIMQSMSPQLRMRGRLIEFAIRELAHMLKFGFLQWYNAPRRMAILGPDGLTLEDFDFDPANMIPDGGGFLRNVTDTDGNVTEGETELNEFAGLSKVDRAIKHAANFTFYVTPNSMLQMSLNSKKAQAIMLRKMGEIDHNTFLEIMEVSNVSEINKNLTSEIDQLLKARDEALAAPVGRPATNQQAPKIETREGGRPTVATS